MEADDAPEAAVQLLCTRAFIFSVFTSKKRQTLLLLIFLLVLQSEV